MQPKKAVLVMLVACLLIFTGGSALAQPNLSLSATVTQFDVIFANDLDFASAPNWFQITLVLDHTEPIQVILTLELFKDGDLLASAETNPFQAQVGNNVYDGNDFGSTIEIQSSQIFDSGIDVTNAILSKGVLPTGVYLLRINADAVGFSVFPPPAEVELNVTNSFSAIEAISPGIVALGTNPTDWPTFYSSIITFIWFTTAENTTLEVVKALDLNNLESNFDQDPEILVQLSGGTTTFTSQSGSSSDPNVVIEKFVDLTPGFYLWRIVANVATTGGTENYAGDQMGFQIANAQGLSGNYTDRAKEILKNILGEARVDELFGPGGALENAIMTGEITKNDQAISLEKLNELVQQLNDGSKQVIDNGVQ